MSLARTGGGMGIFDPTRLESGIALEAGQYKAAAVSPALRRAIYLDANATAPPLKLVVEAVGDAMRSGAGNPASAHAGGAAARRCCNLIAFGEV
jgi:hypothetical protein